MKEVIEQKDMIIIRKGDTSFAVTNKDSIAEYVYVEGLDMTNIDFSIITESNLPSGWELSENKSTLMYPIPPLPTNDSEDCYDKIEERGHLIVTSISALIDHYNKCKGE